MFLKIQTYRHYYAKKIHLYDVFYYIKIFMVLGKIDQIWKIKDKAIFLTNYLAHWAIA